MLLLLLFPYFGALQPPHAVPLFARHLLSQTIYLLQLRYSCALMLMSALR